MKTLSGSGSLTHRLLISFAVFCLLMPAGLIGLHLATPSDGVRLARSMQVFAPQGAILAPYSNEPGPLHSGDILIAVDKTSIERRAGAFFRPNFQEPVRRVGERVEYTVLRDGRVMKVDLLLTRLPWRAIIADHWGVLLFFLFAQAIAGFVYWQRRFDPAAQAFWIWAFSGSHTYSWAFFLQPSDLLYGIGFWLFRAAGTGLWLVFWAAAMHMILIFPRQLVAFKRLDPRLLLLYISPFAIFALYLLGEWFYVENMLAWWNAWSVGELIIAAIYMIPTSVLMFVQYATAKSEVERRKIRLVMFSGLISAGLGLGLYFLPALLLDQPFVNPNGLGLINFPFIIGIAIAIWRYHLFDIDVIIRRTLVYSILSGALVGVYFASVTLLQGIFTTASGQSSTAAIVLSTLAIAALFSPLRRRIQEFIDRRFYRQKYDAEKALAEFAAAARSETDLAQLSTRLTDTVQEALQPERMSLWLNPFTGYSSSTRKETS